MELYERGVLGDRSDPDRLVRGDGRSAVPRPSETPVMSA